MTKAVLITVDALRKDVTYSDRVDTPNIDRLMSKGQVFDKAYANGSTTPSAFPAILASSKSNDGIGCPDTRTVAEAFSNEGFETIAISTNPNSGPYNGYGRGFDHFEDFVKSGAEKEEKSFLFKIGRRIVHSSDTLYSFVRKNRSKLDLPYERAEALNEELFSRLEEGEDQFFFVHYMETHNPYLPPEGYVDTESEAWKDRFDLNEEVRYEEPREELNDKIWELYKGELRYLDEQIGELLDRIESLDEEVIMIFTADHGEQFGEFGSYFHPGNLRNIQINIPLILYGVKAEGELFSHLDIGPTLLGALGKGTEGFDGMDLTEEERHAVTVNLEGERCVVTPDWKLLDTEEERCLFDIDDYLEKGNLAEERKEVVEELEPMLETVPAVQGIEI